MLSLALLHYNFKQVCYPLSSVFSEFSEFGGELERVIAYIDGFNLYFGLKSSGWQRYYWLNLRRMVLNLLKPKQNLVITKYFTARVSFPADKQKRQATFIEALETLPDFRIYYGKYQINPRKCRQCHFEDLVPNEKMTDVYIAVELLTDAFQDFYDTALLISADSDLTPPLTAMKRLFPGKELLWPFLPTGHPRSLKLLQVVISVLAEEP